MLKSLRPILFLMVIASPCITSEILDACLPKNRFLPELDNAIPGLVFSQVASYDNPDTCGGQWKKFGACCEVDKLTNYTREDKKNITNAINKLSGITQTIAKDYLKARSDGARYKILIKGFIRELIDFMNSRSMGSFNQIMETFKNRPKFEQILNQCWDFTWQIRSNSLCSTCVGNSEVFFKGGKALIQEQDCENILDKCKPLTVLIFEFFEMISPLLDKVLAVGSSKNLMQPVIDKLKKVTQKVKDIVNEIEKNDIITLTKNLKAPQKNKFNQGNAQSKEAKLLCEKLVRLHEKPFIVFIADLLDNIDKAVAEVMSLMTKLAADEQTPIFPIVSNFLKNLNNFNIGRLQNRKLQADSGSSIIQGLDSPKNDAIQVIPVIFYGDVQVVCNLCPSHSSYFDSSNKTEGASQPHGQPMNLKNVFP